ncbi:ABC-2 type transport system permease protein [Gracilibacillus ureilyticus]|uniref:ABC-2 type transport system permease protein n=1 Tax=Gracilibacillus ureilyticus TaxID=531814 RepID=A0A1H9Q9R5_9BACI|nr:ABC transporter permease [Gracilibacillus ureilyticus]SER57142.1 ABC-2 type transport system permease protein [Gracilibacillus ureilyticus]
MLFHSVSRLFFLKWKLNKVNFLTWAFSVVLITILTASAYGGLYKTDQERQAVAETMANPAMIAMVGPGFGLDHYTSGAMLSHQMLLFTLIVMAVMSILVVTKQTRTEEDDGILEIVRSLPVGRLTPLTASLLFTMVLNITIGILVAIGLILINIEGIDAEGALLYGMTLTCGGLIFSGVAAISAQMAETARAATGYSITFLMAAYLLRAIGDVSNEMWSMISPLGILIRGEVFVSNKYFPVIIGILLFMVFLAFAFWLNDHRDVGAGYIRSRNGRERAAKYLMTSLGIAVRIQRTTIISWFTAMFLLGISYGSVFGDLEAFFENNEVIQQMLGNNPDYTLTEQFITMLMVVLAIFSTVPGLLFFLKIRGEEKKGRLEHLLVRGTSRIKIVTVYGTISVGGTVISMFLAVFGLWISSSAVMEEAIPLINLLQAGMAYLPAMLLLIGVALFLFGWLPRITSLVWFYLIFSFIVVYIGGLLNLPDWIVNISSFAHIPQLPVEEWNNGRLAILLTVDIIIISIGMIGYRKRDAAG